MVNALLFRDTFRMTFKTASHDWNSWRWNLESYSKPKFGLRRRTAILQCWWPAWIHYHHNQCFAWEWIWAYQRRWLLRYPLQIGVSAFQMRLPAPHYKIGQQYFYCWPKYFVFATFLIYRFYFRSGVLIKALPAAAPTSAPKRLATRSAKFSFMV